MDWFKPAGENRQAGHSRPSPTDLPGGRPPVAGGRGRGLRSAGERHTRIGRPVRDAPGGRQSDPPPEDGFGSQGEGNMRRLVQTNGNLTGFAAPARWHGPSHGRQRRSPCQSDSFAVAVQKRQLRGRTPKGSWHFVSDRSNSSLGGLGMEKQPWGGVGSGNMSHDILPSRTNAPLAVPHPTCFWSGVGKAVES
jgi:hypothetical protein